MGTYWSSDATGEPVSEVGSVEPMALGRNALRHAALAAVFTDRRALDDDPVPGLGLDRNPRGWWGDAVHGVEHGCRAWLLERAVLTQASIRAAENYVVEALQFLLDQRIATKVEATATRDGNRLSVEAYVWRRDGSVVELQFADLWGAV